MLVFGQLFVISSTGKFTKSQTLDAFTYAVLMWAKQKNMLEMFNFLLNFRNGSSLICRLDCSKNHSFVHNRIIHMPIATKPNDFQFSTRNYVRIGCILCQWSLGWSLWIQFNLSLFNLNVVDQPNWNRHVKSVHFRCSQQQNQPIRMCIVSMLWMEWSRFAEMFNL